MAFETGLTEDGADLRPVMVVSTFVGTVLILMSVAGALLGGDAALAGVGRNAVADGLHFLGGVAIVVGSVYDDGARANDLATLVGTVLILLALVGLLVAPVGAVLAMNLLTSAIYVVFASLLLGVGLMFRDPRT